MIVFEYQDIELDYCVNCHGAWFDHGELELLLKSANLECSQLHLDEAVNLPEAKTAERKRKCPICNSKMRKSGIVPGADVLIDVCRRGHGLWLDGGEINQLIRQIAAVPMGTDDAQNKVFSFIVDMFHAQGKISETA
jgi:Zn-finger nucleic acid-binding protein